MATRKIFTVMQDDSLSLSYLSKKFCWLALSFPYFKVSVNKIKIMWEGSKYTCFLSQAVEDSESQHIHRCMEIISKCQMQIMFTCPWFCPCPGIWGKWLLLSPFQTTIDYSLLQVTFLPAHWFCIGWLLLYTLAYILGTCVESTSS